MKKGFTLIELLVVIVILALLAMIGLASYKNSRKRANDSSRKGTLKGLQNAFEQYYADNETYAGCAAMLPGYYQGGLPTDAEYTRDCSGSTYCYCATMEMGGGGNSSDASCTFGGTTHFCVENQQ